MLDTLPTELILRTFELSVPDVHPIYGNRERTQQLRLYSHVNRRLRACAQPLVWKVVGVDDEFDKADALEEARTTDSAAHVKILSMSGSAGFEHTVHILEALPGAVDVRLTRLRWRKERGLFPALARSYFSDSSSHFGADSPISL